MNLWEAIVVVERMKRVKVELAKVDRIGARSKEIGEKHAQEVNALELVLDAARREGRR